MSVKMICILCPRGCHLEVDEHMNVLGNHCPRGIVYAETEIKSPTRVLTTTIRTVYQSQPRISCKTDKPIPKNLIFKAMDEINQKVIDRPMMIGDVVIENILNTGSNIVLTKPCKGEDD